MASKKEVEERRERVQAFTALGLKGREVAKQLGVTERTIRKDIAFLEKAAGGERLKKSKEALVGLLAMRQEARIKRLWSVFSDTSSHSVKINALEKLGNEDDRFVKQAQMVGILPRDNEGIMIVDNKGGVIAQTFNVLEIVDSVLAAEEKIKKGVVSKSLPGPEEKREEGSDQNVAGA